MDESTGPGEQPAELGACRFVLHPLLVLIAGGCLLSFVGWTGRISGWQHWCCVVAGIVFALERAWLFLKLKPRGKERLRLAAHAVLAGLVLVVAVRRGGGGVGRWRA